jgi:predicted  nucleic acid-binding Zn-ribbon protein
MGWWKRNKELKDEIGRLEHQIKLMQDHIQAQKEEKMSLNKKVLELEKLLDIAQNTKRY